MPKPKETPQRPVQTSAGDLFSFVEGRFWNSLDTWHNLESWVMIGLPPSENNHNFNNCE